MDRAMSIGSGRRQQSGRLPTRCRTAQLWAVGEKVHTIGRGALPRGAAAAVGDGIESGLRGNERSLDTLGMTKNGYGCALVGCGGCIDLGWWMGRGGPTVNPTVTGRARRSQGSPTLCDEMSMAVPWSDACMHLKNSKSDPSCSGEAANGVLGDGGSPGGWLLGTAQARIYRYP